MKNLAASPQLDPQVYKNPAKGGQRGGGKTLVESACGASQHLNYYANRNSTKNYGIEVLGFYCPYPRCCYPLVSSGGEFQMFCRRRCPPFADLFRYMMG
jgi:hypothetical protein